MRPKRKNMFPYHIILEFMTSSEGHTANMLQRNNFKKEVKNLTIDLNHQGVQLFRWPPRGGLGGDGKQAARRARMNGGLSSSTVWIKLGLGSFGIDGTESTGRGAVRPWFVMEVVIWDFDCDGFVHLQVIRGRGARIELRMMIGEMVGCE
ncbi:hypothetical protein M0R45_019606 [Rubus argutus]|uniref:Uncharacterized protein n=1 Tax=Rubus argutus TaxID=59490 RepID=A0AAW1X8B7_RUBAR